MTDDAGEGADATNPFSAPLPWKGPSVDPNDEQFGDAVELAALDGHGPADAPASSDPRPAEEFEAVLVGEPYDGAVIGHPGAAEAPRAIRGSLAAAKTHHAEFGAVEAVGDLGNLVPTADTSVSTVQDRLCQVTERVHDVDAVPVFLGGDNSLTYPNVAPLLDGTVGVVNVDAHLDCREVRPDRGPTSGTPYRQLIEEGLDSLTVVGARDFETTTAYHEYLREQGGSIVSPDAVGDDPEAAAERALGALGPVESVYLSVDMDVLDAAAAPGVSASTPGGLATRELYQLVDRLAADERVAGFEVVECAPPHDHDRRTVAAAARAVAHFLAGLTVAPTRSPEGVDYV